MLKSEVETLVIGQIKETVVDSSLAENVVSTTPLVELGLNSLMLAQLLIELEAELDVDPFAEDLSITEVHTVGDLVNAYESALAAGAAV